MSFDPSFDFSFQHAPEPASLQSISEFPTAQSCTLANKHVSKVSLQARVCTVCGCVIVTGSQAPIAIGLVQRTDVHGVLAGAKLVGSASCEGQSCARPQSRGFIARQDYSLSNHLRSYFVKSVPTDLV